MRTGLADVREIAALVEMPALLRALGLTVNERTRRCACLLHSGMNPSAFAWTEAGFWKCHSCGAGGDKIGLVRAVRRCGFRESVEYLAALVGMEYKPGLISREEIERQKHARVREAGDASALLGLEHAAWFTTQHLVLQLEGIRRDAGRRLEAIHCGEPERWKGEEEFCWRALAEVYRQMPRAAAAYCCISYAQADDRFAFSLDLQARERLMDEALHRGWVASEKGSRFEVRL